MSRAANHKTRRSALATPKLRSIEETLEWIRTSYVHALTRRGVSPRKLAALVGAHHDTTADWKSGETPVNVAKFLLDPRFDRDFIACLSGLLREDRKRRARKGRR